MRSRRPWPTAPAIMMALSSLEMASRAVEASKDTKDRMIDASVYIPCQQLPENPLAILEYERARRASSLSHDWASSSKDNRSEFMFSVPQPSNSVREIGKVSQGCEVPHTESIRFGLIEQFFTQALQRFSGEHSALSESRRVSGSNVGV